MKTSSLLISSILVLTVMATTGWSQTNSYSRQSTPRVLLLAQATIPNPMTVETIRASVQGTNPQSDFLKPEQIADPPRDKAGNIIPEGGGTIILPDGSKVQISRENQEENTQNHLPLVPQTPSQVTPISKPLPTNKIEPSKIEKSPLRDTASNPYRRVYRGTPNHCLAADYYPGFFNNNPNARNSGRAVPPVSAYGKNLYGQPCSYGTLSARLGCANRY